jgi:hypothetical protein
MKEQIEMVNARRPVEKKQRFIEQNLVNPGKKGRVFTSECYVT